MNTLLAKYWQPNSMTFWTGLASFVAGLAIMLGGGTTPLVAQLAPISTFAAGFFPGQAGGDLVVAGLGLIGIRAAIAQAAVKTLTDAAALAKAVTDPAQK